MTIDQFIAKTKAIIAEDGLDGYLPTLMLETRRAVRYSVLADVPSDVDAELFAKEWASQVAKHGSDYLLAFRFDNAHFKVVSRRDGVIEERVIAVEPV